MNNDAPCVFCEIPVSKHLLSNEYFYVIQDKHPVARGHSLVISKRHVSQYFDLNEAESLALLETVKELKELLEKRY